jgi:hypothetical protein
MPFKQKNNGSIEFVRLPLDKCVYGVEKGAEGRKYFYLRRFDLSGLKYDSVRGFASSALHGLNDSSSEDDWIIPIKTSNKLNYGMLQQYASHERVVRLLALPVESRPWFSIIKTPNDIAYFAKRRLSASTALQTIGLAASLLNPATAVGAIAFFARKQHFKYNMSKSRGEQDPSIMPKVFVHKIWQVSLTGESDEIYSNIAQILASSDTWTDWS